MNNMNFDPLTFQAFLNMMKISQFSSPNNFNLNNLMNQFNMMNPNFFGNNLQNQNFNQQFNNQINIIQNGGVIMRPNQAMNNSNLYLDPFPFYQGNRINILFETGPGLKMNIASPPNISVKELLLTYIHKVGVSESLLGKKIFFLANGKSIPCDEKRAVNDYFKEHFFGVSNQVKVIVVDASNIIGA